jgi:nicotinic acid phosphoribosyltransferase
MTVPLCRYKAVGIRLDSGDLAYLSTEVRKFFCAIERDLKVPDFGKMIVTASNDLNEETVDALNKQVNLCLTLKSFYLKAYVIKSCFLFIPKRVMK